MTALKTHTIALILEYIRDKGMAMTMKTVGLLLWASQSLSWADHVFKVGDPPCKPHAAQQPHILHCPSPTYFQPSHWNRCRSTQTRS